MNIVIVYVSRNELHRRRRFNPFLSSLRHAPPDFARMCSTGFPYTRLNCPALLDSHTLTRSNCPVSLAFRCLDSDTMLS